MIHTLYKSSKSVLLALKTKICSHFRKQYVGYTEDDLRKRHAEHKQDVEAQGTLVGRHFASVCGYDNWSVTIIDKCPQPELRRRHRFWVDELVTRFPVGLNESQLVN